MTIMEQSADQISTSQASRPSTNLPAFIIEILVIIVAGIFAASAYADFDPAKRLGGVETEYLTRTAYSLSTFLREEGYVPLWDPYMEYGDPMLENPVSFAFNPFLTWPSVLFGAQNGIKVSVILTAIIAGIGGWALARVLGLGALARLLLALLCIGKGNMHSYLSQGHFAFFASQAYFPWIFAGIVGILRGYRRWPVIMAALAIALVFWTGSPWYIPAILISIGVLTLCYVIDIRARNGARFRYAIRVDWARIGLVILSLLLTVCLTAVTLLPLWAKKDYIGGSTVESDFRADLGVILAQYFSGFKELGNTDTLPIGTTFAYYSFVSPVWYALLLAALVLIVGWVRRKLPAMPWRIVGAATILFVFCTLWGAGQNPIIELSYQIIPLAAQFRHVERALGMSAMWLAVIFAVGVDSLWGHLVRNPIWIGQNRLPAFISRQKLRWLIAVAFILVTGLASYQVIDKWHESWGSFFVRYEDQWEDYCVTWLREQYPDRELSIWTLDYKNIYTYYRNRVRHGWVASDFYHAQPIPSTVFGGSLIPRGDNPPELLPEFALGLPHFPDNWLERYGYKPMMGSADPYRDNIPCVYQREGAYSYAYWVTQRDLDTHPGVLPSSFTHPITTFARRFGRIGVLAQATREDDVVVTVQELAYPGWQVQVDGKSALLQSVGGQIGVILPRDGRQHMILFQFLPSRFFLGSAITLFTALACILYLLHAHRIIPKAWRDRFVPRIIEAWDLDNKWQ
jgi:hypothetical protein